MPKLHGVSVVITGASSGIGKATALAFAREGANVTLASRDGKKLAAVAALCERQGGQAHYSESDVADARAMRAVAQAAVKRFGRVDVWVNNAGIGAVGRFTDVPVEAHDQVISTNLMGYLHGSHAVLPYFMARHAGVLINVISFAAIVGPPFGASYTATKFGLRGLSESLRAELQDEPGIHICDVFPGFVDTPGVGHAGNYTGHRLNAKAPDRPEQVADAIVRLSCTPFVAMTLSCPYSRAMRLHDCKPHSSASGHILDQGIICARFQHPFCRITFQAPLSSHLGFRLA